MKQEPNAASEPAPVTREEMHCRQIEMRGYRRSDGLFEVEGRVIDRKSHDFIHPAPGRSVPAGEPIHDMGVRLVYDRQMMVHEVHTFTNRAPYAPCVGGGQALQEMKGVRMVGGWSQEVRARLRGAKSCTHLMELLVPLATAAHQTLGYIYSTEPPRLNANGRPLQIDSCYAYAADSEVVLKRWPNFYRRPADSKPSTE